MKLDPSMEDWTTRIQSLLGSFLEHGSLETLITRPEWSLIDDALARFMFYYPLFMAYVWMIGAVVYFWRHERRKAGDVLAPPVPSEAPKVSILVPCYNEADNVRETIAFCAGQNYPNFDILAINDGSRDNTLEILQELCETYPTLRIINLASNQGKAVGLRTAALLTDSDYLVCIDGDALLAPDAILWLVRHFIKHPDVGAVTGNPRIRNRSTLLGRVQVGEFSAIVGMIKRAQRLYGRIFTISGVIGAFRKSALADVGYWSPDMVTEDIDISWKLQLAGWTIRFEPRALCWVLMPETLLDSGSSAPDGPKAALKCSFVILGRCGDGVPEACGCSIWNRSSASVGLFWSLRLSSSCPWSSSTKLTGNGLRIYHRVGPACC